MLFKKRFRPKTKNAAGKWVEDRTAEWQQCEKWSFRFELDGEVIQGSTGTANRKEAEKIAKKKHIEAIQRANGLLPKDERPMPTLRGFEKEFRRSINGKVSPRTAVYYDDALQHCLKFEPLASARLDAIDAGLLEEFVQTMQERAVSIAVCIGDAEPTGETKRYSAITINHSLRALRRCLHVAKRLKYLTEVPLMPMLKEPESRDFVITEETLSKLLALCKTRPADLPWSAPRQSMAPEMAPLLTVLYDTGMRAGEAARLEWRDVNLAGRGSIHIRFGKTKNARRFIPLTERVKAVLTDLKENAKAGAVFVFARRGFDSITVGWASHQMTWACRYLQLKGCCLHSTRHSYCSRLGAAGADAFSIMKLAGHADIRQSQKYVHPSEERLNGTVALLDRKPVGAVVTESNQRAARA